MTSPIDREMVDERRIVRIACVMTVLVLIALSPALPQRSMALDPNWSSYHGLAYKAGSNVWYCVQNLGSCDSPAVAPPDVAFAVYRANGFNFARISLDWNYFFQNSSGARSILTQDANACDSNGIACYYMWGGSYQFIPTPISAAWSGTAFNSNFAADMNIPSVGTPWDGQPAWSALWNGLFVPAIQILDSHPSTVGYAFENEPGQGWSDSQLIAYYKYEAQQLRTISSKAFIFQANGGGEGGGGSATIGQLAPSGFGPYVFEIHNYQDVNSYDPYPSVVTQCQGAGCAGVILGEWGASSSVTQQFMNDELNAVKANGMGEQWFSYDDTSVTTGALAPVLQTLAQVQVQVFGTTITTTSVATTTTSMPTTTGTVSASTTTSTATTVMTSTPPYTVTTTGTAVQTSTASTSNPQEDTGGFGLMAAAVLVAGLGAGVYLYLRRKSANSPAAP